MQPDELNLLEDGLQLWLIAIRNAPAPQSWLLDLFPNLCAVMEKSTGERGTRQTGSKNAHFCNNMCANIYFHLRLICYDLSLLRQHAIIHIPTNAVMNFWHLRAEHIAVCSAVVQSCILLGGAEFLSAHGKTLVDMLCKLLGNVNERGMLLLLHVMALMLCMRPEHMPGVMQRALQCLLHILLTDQESTQVTAGWLCRPL